MNTIQSMKLLSLLCLGILTGTPAYAAETKQPNIIVILADDLGNADLGYRGSPIRTPHIDALAAGGVRLEAFYGQPVTPCSIPTSTSTTEGCPTRRRCCQRNKYPTGENGENRDLGTGT